MSGSIWVVGIGPGSLAHLTPAAREALEAADVIVGYKTYLQLLDSVAVEVPREASGMKKEVARVCHAVDLAKRGSRVALVSSGDAGIYGMAGLVYEVLRQRDEPDIAVQVIPGISALNAAASLLGAPLMLDFAVVSLSDQLIPLNDILQRLEAAAQADFVLCLYNPKGHARTVPFERCCEILTRWRPAETPVGIVRAAYRDGQRVQVTTLAGLPAAEVDMLTVIIVGNSHTALANGKMVTARGYADKYELDGLA